MYVSRITSYIYYKDIAAVNKARVMIKTIITIKLIKKSCGKKSQEISKYFTVFDRFS